MTYSFNLVEQAWIPCLLPDGALVELGVYETLRQAHQLREIRGDTPLETAALHRLLLAILHRVFGPSSRAEWKSLWHLCQFDTVKLDRYLHDLSIKNRFDLFGDSHRFFQAHDPHAIEKSVANMIIHTASGNNATVFDHSTEDVGLTLTPAQAARALLVSQMFGLGGLSGVQEKFTDAPCAKGILFLACASNLFGTLTLNLIRYDEDVPLPTLDSDDRPAWEMNDPFLPFRAQPKGYLDYLTWHNRRIWLFPEETPTGLVVRKMCWAPGLVLKAEAIDPMKHYSADKQNAMQPLCFTTERSLWRDSSVLFEIGTTTKPPHVVRWLASLAQPPHSVLEISQSYQLMALGMAKSRASPEFLRAEHLPLPTSFLTDPNQVSALSHSLQTAEHAAIALRSSAFLLAWLVLHPDTASIAFNAEEKIEHKIQKGRNPKSDDRDAQNVFRLAYSWGTERHFWSNLEHHFHYLLQDLATQPETAMQKWYSEVHRAARAAFDDAERYAGTDLRPQRSVAVARQFFDRRLAAVSYKVSSLEQSSTGGN